ncbi:hypothetical protein AB205_0062850 [Aquarana catesbeiana]|uniref:Uncharacterized protein n=1 Tax=Aquarana catesbeiana TaxID=8400 RepID=A0A2G9RKR3_AQUCT|nr:hypothetical protein AB205_0062850 [Aquarana catesbeiana]
MFHIPISAIKYQCAKYTYFCSHRGEKTRRTSLIRGDNGPPTSGRREKSPKPNQRRRRETLSKLSPQQVIVMLWKKNVISQVKVPRSSWGDNGV